MIRVKFWFGSANRKEMSWMSETSALMDTLRQEGISPDLLRAVEEYRASHELSEILRPRIPSPAFVYYGREVWEQALAALLCGENLLLAGGKATGKNVLAENLAAAFGRPAWDISFHVNMDAASLIGMDTFEGGQGGQSGRRTEKRQTVTPPTNPTTHSSWPVSCYYSRYDNLFMRRKGGGLFT